MNITKRDVLLALSKHTGWVKPRTIAKELGLSTTEGISRVSNILYRLRHAPRIERKRNSHAYQYRYGGEIAVYPTSEKAYLKTEGKEKAIRDRDSGGDVFTGFTFIEPLNGDGSSMEEGYCEVCGLHTQIAFRAEKDDCVVFLCQKHGKAVNEQLGGYGGMF